jgi:hypothetical protein
MLLAGGLNMVISASRAFFTVAVLVFALSSAAPAATIHAPAQDAPINQPERMAASATPAAFNKALSEKRLRLRQIVLLWLLAAHPAR